MIGFRRVVLWLSVLAKLAIVGWLYDRMYLQGVPLESQRELLAIMPMVGFAAICESIYCFTGRHWRPPLVVMGILHIAIGVAGNGAFGPPIVGVVWGIIFLISCIKK